MVHAIFFVIFTSALTILFINLSVHFALSIIFAIVISAFIINQGIRGQL